MSEHLIDRLGRAIVAALVVLLLLGGGATGAWAVALAVFLVVARPLPKRGHNTAVAGAFIAALGAGALTAVVALVLRQGIAESAYAALVSGLAVSAVVEWRLVWRLGRAESAFGDRLTAE